MSPGYNFGLQWRLAFIYLAVGILSATTALAGCLFALHSNLSMTVSIGIGLAVGFFMALIGTVVGTMIVRKLKLRIWEAGRMAGRIARGEYRARLNVGSHDELGWLEEQLNLMAYQLETAITALKNLAEQNRRLGEEAGRGAALEERTRLARDLHDTVNQQLFVLAMRAAATRRRLEQDSESSSAIIDELNMLEEIARQAHSQTRDLIMQIRPVTLEKAGLGAALKEYIKTASERESWEVIERIDLSVRPEGNTAESMFRISQEALNNVSKHAAAKQVEIVLKNDSDSIVLSIADDGVGFNLRSGIRPTSVGLTGIRERVTKINGDLIINTAPGQGTVITVRVPHDTGGGENR